MLRTSVRFQFVMMLIVAVVALVAFACVATPPRRDEPVWPDLPMFPDPVERYDIDRTPCAPGHSLWGRCSLEV